MNTGFWLAIFAALMGAGVAIMVPFLAKKKDDEDKKDGEQ